ncbi:MAG: ABC transporter ATP-binding protein [FCB group bacterium]|nr:ABC transporter ATP-binding protein [FCB group bacterium]
MTHPEHAIQIRALKKNYDGFQALKGIDLKISEGSFFGLLGPNGAGKTTTIGILTGLVRLTSGEAKIFGKDVVRDFRFTRKSVGLSPQELNFDPFFTIRDLLTLQAGYYGLARTLARQRTAEVLDLLGLTAKADAKMRELSGGMKRRVQIAKALIHDPPILILDEPTAGVDIELRHMLWHHLKEMNRSGKTILLTTHYIEEAEKLCSDIAIIDNGSIIAEGSPAGLINSLGKSVIKLKVRDWKTSYALKNREYNLTGNELTVRTNNSVKDMPDLISAVIALGAGVEEARVYNSSLEDVFVQLTGKNIDD